MRIRIWAGAIVGVALMATIANAQDYANVRTFLENSPEYKIANPVVQQLARVSGAGRFNWAIIERGQEPEHLGRPVWLPVSVIRELKTQPGQLAFVIAQAIAKNEVPARTDAKHLVCTDEPRRTLAALGDPRDYDVKSRAECESLADPIAIRYVAAAGYNPLDATAFLASVVSGRFNDVGRPALLQAPWVRDYADMYAVDSARLLRLRRSVDDFCRENAERCR